LAVRRLFSGRLALVGAAVTLIAVVVAVAAPMLSPPHPPQQTLGTSLASPSRVHPLGTDNVGRDVFSRVIWGTRISLVAGFGSVIIAVVAGGLLCLLAGYARGRGD